MRDWPMASFDSKEKRCVTASFVQKDGRTLHVRKTTRPEPDLLHLYNAHGLAHQPRGVQKLTS
jgi:hypothetical protein